MDRTKGILRFLVVVSLVAFISCNKVKPVQDYRSYFTGIYAEGYTSIEITAGDSVNLIHLEGIPEAESVDAVIVNPNKFNIIVQITAHSSVYGGPGCGYCLLMPAHILRISGYGQKTETGLYILTLIEKKYSMDSDFSLIYKIELNLVRYL